MFVLNRSDYFKAMEVLYFPDVHIFEAGSLWVTVQLNSNQISVLESKNIKVRKVN
jgi:hypothetical protein